MGANPIKPMEDGMTAFENAKESLADEFLNIAAASIIKGYNEASIDAGVKVLSLIICRIENIPDVERKSLEEDLKWLVKEKIQEFKKTR